MKEGPQAGPSKVGVVCQMDTREEEDGLRGLQTRVMDVWRHTPPSKQQAAGAGWRAGVSGGVGAEGREAGRDAIGRAVGSRASTVWLSLNGSLQDLFVKLTLFPVQSSGSPLTALMASLDSTTFKQRLPVSTFRFHSEGFRTSQ